MSSCAAVGASALLIAGCGSIADSGSGGAPTHAATGSTSTTRGTSSAGTTSAAKISLVVSFSGSAAMAPAHYTLRCEPAGGSVRDAAAACTKLMRHGASLFAPLRTEIACPMIMSSAGRVTVSGTYLGKPVHEIVIDGGCDLSRWAEIGQIFRYR